MLTLKVNGYLTSHSVEILSPIDIFSIKEILTCPDKTQGYIKSQVLPYMGKSGNIPDRVIKLFSLNNGIIKYPTGLLPRVLHILKKYNPKIDWGVVDIKPSPLPDKLPLTPHNYQLEALEKLLSLKRTIVKAPTGSGKTFISYLVCESFPTANILVLAPSIDATENLYQTYLKYGLKVGIISGRTYKPDRITVAMKRSLATRLKKGECIDLVSKSNVIIYDEVHTFGNANEDTLTLKYTTNAKYKIGFTATPSRSDNILYMEQHVSKVGVELKPEEVAIVKPTAMMVYVPPLNILNYFFCSAISSFEFKPIYINDKPQRADVYAAGIVRNQIRNQMICHLIETYHNNSSNRPQLIVLDLIEHGEILQKMLKKRGLDIPFISGRDKCREEYLEKLRRGEIKSLISSSIFKTAVNIPNLGVVINAGGGSSKHLNQQLVGRVTRIDGDKVGIVIDFLDDCDYYLRSNSRQRKQSIEEGFNLEMNEVELWQASQWLSSYEK